jgi:hypothetical protein
MMAEHTIYRGALQTLASELIGQNTQQRSGENEFHQGLRQLERIREERMRKEAARASQPTPRKRKLRKPSKPVELQAIPLFRLRLEAEFNQAADGFGASG